MNKPEIDEFMAELEREIELIFGANEPGCWSVLVQGVFFSRRFYKFITRM